MSQLLFSFKVRWRFVGFALGQLYFVSSIFDSSISKQHIQNIAKSAAFKSCVTCFKNEYHQNRKPPELGMSRCYKAKQQSNYFIKQVSLPAN